MSWVRIDVDLDEVYGEMSRNDKRDMAEWLHEDGILHIHQNHEIRRLVRGEEESFNEKELRDNLTKLWNGHYLLSNEDEEIIKQIASKL